MHTNIPDAWQKYVFETYALLPWVDMPCGLPFRMSQLYFSEGCTINQQDPQWNQGITQIEILETWIHHLVHWDPPSFWWNRLGRLGAVPQDKQHSRLSSESNLPKHKGISNECCWCCCWQNLQPPDYVYFRERSNKQFEISAVWSFSWFSTLQVIVPNCIFG